MLLFNSSVFAFFYNFCPLPAILLSPAPPLFIPASPSSFYDPPRLAIPGEKSYNERCCADAQAEGGKPMAREKNRYIFAPEQKRRERRHGFRNAVLVLLPLLIAGLLLSNLVISRHVKLNRVSVTVLNLPADLENYSILHLSDLHGEVYGEHQKAIEAALGSLRYSCVVMTGDMLGEDQEIQPLLDLIALMPSDTPKYLIPGDRENSWLNSFAHGSLSVYADWALALQQAGVTLLDVPVKETRGKGTIWFVPEELYTLNLDNMETVFSNQLKDQALRATSLTADDAAYRRVLEYELDRMQRIREIRKEFGPEDMQVVLTHTPLTGDYVQEAFSLSGKEDYFSMRYAGLILAGHYNGGQWRLPFGGAVWVPELGWFPPDGEVQGFSYPAGIPQYISPGLGSAPQYTWEPGRLFNPPTITLITLTRKAV